MNQILPLLHCVVKLSRLRRGGRDRPHAGPESTGSVSRKLLRCSVMKDQI
jgi:hypothetical protein